MLIYINGTWIEPENASIPFNDQGFQFGDSLFETIRVNNGIPFRMDRHLDRMRSGMKTIHMDGEKHLAEIPHLLNEFIKKNQIKSALLKVMITRGVSAGITHESDSQLALYISARGVPDPPPWPVKVIFLSEQNYPILRFNPAIKSGNYLGNMLAKKDAEAAGAYEPVFVNKDGYITECAIRNIFFIKNNVLLTPTTELGVLPGVVRETIMELAEKRGLEVREALILKDEINAMDEAFISSTGVGVLPVYWDGYHSEYEQSQSLRLDLQTLFESGESNVA